MRIIDARRLRGPSLGADGPGAMVEVALTRGEKAMRVARAWRVALHFFANRLGRPEMERGARVRFFRLGLALYVPAPIDALDAALALAEAAVDATVQSLAGTPFFMQRHRRVEQELRRTFARERNRQLVSLASASGRRGAPFLFDDDSVTLGHGASAVTYARDALPRPRDVRWRSLERIPVALVTGTNGKTTTTRLVARMAKLAGLVPGNTSSDGVAIDEVIVEAGDNTGGESARRVLRDPRVEIAILETARGGLLRRGLAVRDVDAALITNVSADHLGEHGVLDVATLIETKAVVAQAVRSGGKLVLGADDEGLMRLPGRRGVERVLFAIDPRRVRAHVARGGHAFMVERGMLVHVGPKLRDEWIAVAAIALTAGGTAAYNLKNALAASALAWTLDLARDAIVEALRTFGSRPEDNPGRGGVVTTSKGTRVLLDFGHNPAAAKELYAWAHTLAGAKGRVIAVLTQPGDRDDRAMAAFARAVADSGAERAVVWEAESLLRGRSAGEIVKTLVTALRATEMQSVMRAASEQDAVTRALRGARASDVVVVSPSLDRAVAED